MNKIQYKIKNDEMSIFEFINIISNQKLKIALIVLISAIIAAVLSYKDFQKTKMYEISMTVKSGQEIMFMKFAPFRFLMSESSNFELATTDINGEVIFTRFIESLVDSSKVMVILENNQYIQKTISQLSEEKKKRMLLELSKTLVVKKVDSNSGMINYNLQFQWTDKIEGLEILENILLTGLKNVKDEIFEEMYAIIDIAHRYNKKKDLLKIEYLEDQSLIARELDMPENQFIEQPNNFLLQSNLKAPSIMRTETYNQNYYLRGYKIIDREIGFIKQHDNKIYSYLKDELDSLNKSNTKNWIDYDLYQAEIELKNPSNIKKIWFILIILGLIIALIYVLFTNALKSQISSRENKI